MKYSICRGDLTSEKTEMSGGGGRDAAGKKKWGNMKWGLRKGGRAVQTGVATSYHGLSRQVGPQ